MEAEIGIKQKGTFEYLKSCQHHECEMRNGVFYLPGRVQLYSVLPESPGLYQPE